MVVEVAEENAPEVKRLLTIAARGLTDTFPDTGFDGPRQIDSVEASVLRGLFAHHGDYPAEEQQNEIAAWQAALAVLGRDGETAPEEKSYRTLALLLTAESGQYATMYAAVSALRSGFAEPALLCDGAAIASNWEGPFEVNEVDEAIIQSLAEDIEGYDEGAKSDGEREIVEGRIIRKAARDVATNVIAARGQPRPAHRG
jgi:hypothetical protein